MATHYKIKTEDNNYVHADGLITDHTLCGLTLGGDSYLKIGMKQLTSKKINCPICKRIIRYCHSINKNELTPTT